MTAVRAVQRLPRRPAAAGLLAMTAEEIAGCPLRQVLILACQNCDLMEQGIYLW